MKRDCPKGKMGEKKKKKDGSNTANVVEEGSDGSDSDMFSVSSRSDQFTDS